MIIAPKPLGHEITQAIARYGHAPLPKNDAQYVPTFSGIEFGQFAQTIVGIGQGSIELTCLVRDPGDQNFFLLDGASDTNRLFVFRNGGDAVTNYTPVTGLTVDIDDIGSVVDFGVIRKYTINGDFTGLEWATIAARFNGAAFAHCSVFEIAYKDQAQAFSYNSLLAKPQSYILPDHCSVSRNLVTQNAVTTWDGTEVDYSYQSLGVTGEAGSVYLVTETISEGAVGKVKANCNKMDDAWRSSTSFSRTAVWSPDASEVWVVQTSAGADRFVGTVEIEIRKVSNAIILKNTPANIADMFEQVAQRGDGHYVSAKKIDPVFVANKIHKAGADRYNFLRENYAELTFGSPLSEGEHVYLEGEVYDDCIGYGWSDNDGVVWPSIVSQGTLAGKFTKELKLNDTNLSLYNTQYGIDTEDREIKVRAYHLIKLSDHLQKQFQLEQRSQSVALYESKNKARYVVDLDGVNDRVEVATIPASVGPVVRHRVWFVTTTAQDTRGLFALATDVSDDYRALVVNNTTPNKLKALSSGRTPGVGSRDINDGLVHLAEWAVNVETGESVISIDGSEEYSFTDAQPDEWKKQRALYLGCVANFAGSPYAMLDGSILGYEHIDEGAPLPIGQGGNSLYLPLDGSTLTTDQALYLDSKGRIKAGSGKGDDSGDGAWQGLSADLSEIQAVTRDAEGSLVGENVFDSSHFSGSWVPVENGFSKLAGETGYVGEYYTLGNVEPLQTCDLSVTIESDTDGLFVYTRDADANVPLTGVLSSGEHNLELTAGDGGGLWLARTPFGGSVKKLLIQPKHKLSAELQRQHDLAIVEKTVDKQLKKAQRSMDLAEGDGIDNYVSIPKKIFTGAFKLVIPARFSDGHPTADGSRLCGDLSSNRNFIKWFDASYGGPSDDRFRVMIDGESFTALVERDRSLLHWPVIERDENNDVTVTLNGEVILSFNKAGDFVIESVAAGSSNGTSQSNHLNGEFGICSMLDYADPNDSRFYVHDKDASVYREVLHPDGSMDGTYQGMSLGLDEIQQFTKKGDDLKSAERASRVLNDWPIKTGVSQATAGVFKFDHAGAFSALLRDNDLFQLGDEVEWGFDLVITRGALNFYVGNTAVAQSLSIGAHSLSGRDLAAVSDGRIQFGSSDVAATLSNLSLKKIIKGA